ncbi:MAG: endonuclease [Abditibacteriota bacterium]|nr:endonuclease [Abditibacteriota bacterium]
MTPQSTFTPTKRTIRRIHELLRGIYGSRQPTPRDALDGLILIVLSQATNDINCDRAFQSLKKQFPTWDDVLDATDEEVADAIRSGGLANQKAKRVRQLLAEIKADRGSLDLSWMRDASATECEVYLQKFHGVGPKTIACVLVFFLNKPAFPVDTHVHRVTKRLGWIRPQAGADEAHKVLRELVPDDCKLDLHVNLISHGRAICRAAGNGGPKCGACPIRRHCAFGKSVKLSKEEVAMQRQTTFHGTDFFVTLE